MRQSGGKGQYGHVVLTVEPNEPGKGFEFFDEIKGGVIPGGGGKEIHAKVPLSEMFGYSTTLRSMSQGRATYTMEFSHYAEAPRNVAEEIIHHSKR